MSLRSNKKFVSLVSASTVSNLGDGMATIAYPWLASAITRNPILVALVFVAQRLPWLVFTLPAGVITDRVDRRKAMILMDGLRFALTTVVAFTVLAQQDRLPGPGDVEGVTGTRGALYAVVIGCTLLLGMAEVLRDNSAQTILPAIVPAEDLEKANGRLWSAESVMNTFVGPPLGSLLLGVAFCVPFFVDAGTFFASAALLATIPGVFRADRAPVEAGTPPASWKAEMKEGVRWLWGHEVLRPMAIILGLMNGAAQVSGAVFILFAQEVLHTSPFVFSILAFGGAIGGIVGGQIASGMSRRYGPGTCLAMTLGGTVFMSAGIGLVAWWPAVMVFFAIEALLGLLWNVITVSFRQTIIPSHMLGRVNSVYRFFAWGMMPIGAAVGGLVVLGVDAVASRETALRATWIVNALIHVGLFAVGSRTLTTAKIEAARAAVAAPGAAVPA